MRSLIRSAIHNSPAMNMLMIAVLLVGTVSLVMMQREVFPEFELDIVLITVPYPGATPEDVEQGICQSIEEAVQSIDGIKKITSVANEGAGSVVLELRADVQDVQKIVSEVRSEIDRIPNLPELAEDPEVQQITFREAAIKVGILAPPGTRPPDENELRDVAEFVRDSLSQLKTVSQVELINARDFQIDVELSEETLRKYGLTLQDVAQTLRRENLELPGGTIKSQGQEVLLRGNNKRLIGQRIAELPLIRDPSGTVLTVQDLGRVRDGFSDATAVNEINGRPGIALAVNRTKSEDLLAMTSEVKEFVAGTHLPGGYEMVTWNDVSLDVRDRLEMLISNGIMGLVLVFLVLAVFLEIRLAFWVALGIPVSLLGAGTALLLGGQTLNMLSMFAFLMALGIVVDDAIVVGENVYAHRQSGKSLFNSAVDGTIEVLPSVIASVLTTIVAFCPLFFVSGVMGKFIAVMPFAVVAMLLISLFESTFILPVHLAHQDNLVFRLFRIFFYPLRFVLTIFRWLNERSSEGLEFFIRRIYLPTLNLAVNYRYCTVAAGVALLMASMGLIRSGLVPFTVFPKLDSKQLQATLSFPDGTPASITDSATRDLVEALDEACRELLDGRDPSELVATIYRRVGQSGGNDAVRGGLASGSHIGTVEIELVDPTQRSVTSQEVTNRWRDKVREIPGLESLSMGAVSFGPGGKPIEFKLLADPAQMSQLEAAVEECKTQLASYSGVFDIDDDSRPGKWEFRVRVKDDAQSLGLSTADIAETIRAAYYGEEVMRLQRGRHEVKLMVRYPPEQRRSLSDFQNLQVRLKDAEERPLTELAEVDVQRGYSEINRLDQKRSITVSADIDENQANAKQIVSDLQAEFVAGLKERYPDIQIRWEGQRQQEQESLQSLMVATVVALLVMFVLLTLEFQSYWQPLMIMAIIPFGIIGAILGHLVMGLQLTLFSFFGLVALTGVVVNDSIVLVDFINARVRSGVPVQQAVIDAGTRRLRPVFLTSATTLAGLFPILIERSFQAQILIPMATSLAFGLLMSTLLVLVMVPAFYRVYRDFVPYSPPAPDEYLPGIPHADQTASDAASVV